MRGTALIGSIIVRGGRSRRFQRWMQTQKKMTALSSPVHAMKSTISSTTHHIALSSKPLAGSDAHTDLADAKRNKLVAVLIFLNAKKK